MKISVVIPARNEESFLPDCLAALKRQVRPPDEIVIADNGSTDNTAQLARDMGAVVVDCPQKGVAMARHTGLLAATGDWVATTDADSRPEAEWLYRMEPYMADPANVGLYGPTALFDRSRFEYWFSLIGYNIFLDLMARAGKPNLAGFNMAFRRETALEVGGYPPVEAREDVLLGWELQKKGAIKYVPDALVYISGRKLKAGWMPFLAKQTRTFLGHPEGYFDDVP
jgi:glycosyltransferase involved in cell wall biosynthesis